MSNYVHIQVSNDYLINGKRLNVVKQSYKVDILIITHIPLFTV